MYVYPRREKQEFCTDAKGATEEKRATYEAEKGRQTQHPQHPQHSAELHGRGELSSYSCYISTLFALTTDRNPSPVRAAECLILCAIDFASYSLPEGYPEVYRSQALLSLV